MPVCINNFVFFYKKTKYPSGISDSDLSELAPFRIGILNNSPAIDQLKSAGIKDIDIENSVESNMKKLALDRVDLILTTDLLGLYTLKRIGEGPNAYAMTEGILMIVNSLMVIKTLPNSEDIVETFVEGYSRIKTNGKLKAILEQYFGKDQIPKYFVQ